MTYLYMLEVKDTRKSKYFGHKRIYYTGITDDWKRRFEEHLNGIKSNFLRSNFRTAMKKLVFVMNIPNYQVVSDFERKIKNLSVKRKRALIESDYNLLKN